MTAMGVIAELERLQLRLGVSKDYLNRTMERFSGVVPPKAQKLDKIIPNSADVLSMIADRLSCIDEIAESLEDVANRFAHAVGDEEPGQSSAGSSARGQRSF